MPLVDDAAGTGVQFWKTQFEIPLHDASAPAHQPAQRMGQPARPRACTRQRLASEPDEWFQRQTRHAGLE